MRVKKAAFLDRDGTIIYDVGYLSDLADCRFLPGIIQLLKKLQAAEYVLIVVTNQSGIARGFFDEQFVARTHEYLAAQLAREGVNITAFYYCPHHPEKSVSSKFLVDCDCRKPRPGMLIRAAKDHDIDLKNSLMIGDTARDIEAGTAAGCKAFYIDAALEGALWGNEEKIGCLQNTF